MFSLPECIVWMTIDLTVSVAIVAFNLCTIIAFIKSRNLRKRSTYLLINLAFVDMLVGGFSVYVLFYSVAADCNVWKRHSIDVWAHHTIYTLLFLFSNASLTNIAIIALERAHATFFPFPHRALKKWVYGLIIAAVWVTAALVRSIAYVFLERLKIIFLYLRITFYSTCLLIICASYTSIVIKVRWGAQRQHHGAACRERKLTMTLLIVTVVSLLLYLPYVTLAFIVSSNEPELWLSLPDSVVHAIFVLFYANSLVNPILYAIRLSEYRSALLALFRQRPQRR